MHLKKGKWEEAILVMESPSGHREYQRGVKCMLENLIHHGYVTDKYGFKWRAWIE